MILQVVYGTLWGGLAALNGTLAQDKGDRYWKWFLLSLPLGPLASMLIMVRPVVKGPSDESAA